MYRTLKPGGRVVLQVPYFHCTDAYTDPTHKHFFTSRTLDYVIEGTDLAQYHYGKALFHKKGFWYGWPHTSRNPIKQFLKSLLYRNKNVYDQYLSLLVPVTRCLTWELEK